MDAKLIMFKANGQRKEFPLKPGQMVIGRGEECDLRVPILSVSRKHCEVQTGEEEVKVKDVASSNGTYVNNQRVNEATLKAGDRLAVGPIVFTLQVNGVPEEIRPVKTRGQRMAEAGEPGVEEIVDLEADVVSQTGASSAAPATASAPTEPTPAPPAVEEEEEDVDPISALEALAAESDKEESDKQG